MSAVAQVFNILAVEFVDDMMVVPTASCVLRPGDVFLIACHVTGERRYRTESLVYKGADTYVKHHEIVGPEVDV